MQFSETFFFFTSSERKAKTGAPASGPISGKEKEKKKQQQQSAVHLQVGMGGTTRTHIHSNICDPAGGEEECPDWA
jgi:hypothetical protein